MMTKGCHLVFMLHLATDFETKEDDWVVPIDR